MGLGIHQGIQGPIHRNQIRKMTQMSFRCIVKTMNCKFQSLLLLNLLGLDLKIGAGTRAHQ
jgi:hypothetical protein